MARRSLLAALVVIAGVSSVGCAEGDSPLGRLSTQVVNNRDAEMKKLRSSPYYRPVTQANSETRTLAGALARQ